MAEVVEPVLGETQCLTCDFVGKLKGRGLCSACKRTAERNIKDKLISDKEAVRLGLILPKDHGGRKSPWTERLKERKSQLAKKK